MVSPRRLELLAGYTAPGQFSASSTNPTFVAPDIGTSPVYVLEDAIGALNNYFREQQESLSHDFPDEEKILENSLTLRPDDAFW